MEAIYEAENAKVTTFELSPVLDLLETPSASMPSPYGRGGKKTTLDKNVCFILAFIIIQAVDRKNIN